MSAAFLQTEDDLATFARKRVKLLAHFGQPAAPGQTAISHDAGKNFIRIGMLVPVSLQAEGSGKLLPGGDDQCLGAERRLSLLFELLGCYQDLLWDGAFRNGVHSEVPHATYPVRRCSPDLGLSRRAVGPVKCIHLAMNQYEAWTPFQPLPPMRSFLSCDFIAVQQRTLHNFAQKDRSVTSRRQCETQSYSFGNRFGL